MTVGHAGFSLLRVGAIEQVCDDSVAITFDVPADLSSRFVFRPGQSVTLRRDVDGRDERRSYSICAGIDEPLRIGVRALPGGALSPWLVRSLKVGDEIEVSKPSGRFCPNAEIAARHVLIGAGSGITPLLSIAKSVLAGNVDSTLAIIYGNRTTESIMFLDELADLKDCYSSRLELIHVLSREAVEVELFCGRVDTDRLLELLPVVGGIDDVDEWWLCGPHHMVEGLRSLLIDRGVPSAAIHRELFWVEDAPPAPMIRDDGPAPEGAALEFRLAGRSHQAVVPAGVTILEAAQRIRGDLPFACKGGVCGTCRARVTSGGVRMRRNFALEPEEIDAGFTLTCQAEPVTKAVVIDWDA